MQAQAIELIDKCITVLERDGWRTGSYNLYDPGEPHCLVGALHVAAFGYLDSMYKSNPQDALYAYTKHRIAEHICAHDPSFARAFAPMSDTHASIKIEAWNDAVPTSREEVIEMLQHCKFHMLRAAEMAARPWPELAPAAA